MSTRVCPPVHSDACTLSLPAVTTDELGGQPFDAHGRNKSAVANGDAARSRQQSSQHAAARQGGKAAVRTGAAASRQLPAEANCAPTWSRSATGYSSATAAGQLPAEQCSGRGAGEPTRLRANFASNSGSNRPMLGSSLRTLGRAWAGAQPDARTAGAKPHEPAVVPASRPHHWRAPSDEEQVRTAVPHTQAVKLNLQIVRLTKWRQLCIPHGCTACCIFGTC
jgi:hypothetical protein